MILVAAALAQDPAPDPRIAEARALYEAHKQLSATVVLFPAWGPELSNDGAWVLGHALYDLTFYASAREVLVQAGDAETVQRIDAHFAVPEESVAAWTKCRIKRGDHLLEGVRGRLDAERELNHLQTREDWKAVVEPGLAVLIDTGRAGWEARVAAVRDPLVAVCSRRRP